MKSLVQAALSQPIVANALRVSAVVGTLVNLINQGGPVLDGLAPSWPQVALNYLMPYLVASYSAARNEVRSPHLPVEPSVEPPVVPAAAALAVVMPAAPAEPERLPGHMDLFIRHADTAPGHIFAFAQFIADNEFLSTDPRFSAAWRDAEAFSAETLEDWAQAGRPFKWEAVWRERHRERAVAVIARLKAIAMAPAQLTIGPSPSASPPPA